MAILLLYSDASHNGNGSVVPCTILKQSYSSLYITWSYQVSHIFTNCEMLVRKVSQRLAALLAASKLWWSGGNVLAPFTHPSLVVVVNLGLFFLDANHSRVWQWAEDKIKSTSEDENFCLLTKPVLYLKWLRVCNYLSRATGVPGLGVHMAARTRDF